MDMFMASLGVYPSILDFFCDVVRASKVER